MSLLPLRPYQRDAVDAVHAVLARGMRRPAVVMATGLGKTPTFAHLGTEWLDANPGRRVLVLAHTTELVDQAMQKWRSVAPGLRVGRVQANANETLAPVVVASVQTLRSENRRRMLRNVGMVIVDECHHSTASTYMSILQHYGALGDLREDSAVAVGFTATMMRGDGVALGDVWQDVVYVRSIGDGIADGFLVRPRGLHIEVDDLDLSAVKTTRGDYHEGQLGAAIEESLAPQAIAKAVAEHAPDRKLILFAPTVSSAGVIADALNASGRPTGLIHGGMAAGARKAVLDAYRGCVDGLSILANCQIATEGFDDPETDGVVIARPTRSPVLYRQMAGRALRPWPGKSDALLLDVVGAIKAHSLVSGVELFGEKPEVKEPVQRESLDELDIGLEDPQELAPGQQDARAALLEGRDGPLVATEVDLFAGSTMAWLRTRAGVFFIEAGERYIAILPGRPGSAAAWLDHFGGRRPFCGFDVIAVAKRGPLERREIVGGVEDLAYAMAWAEGAVTAVEKTTATKERSWRARPPSPKLRELAERLRIFVPPGARMGEVSNMVSLVLASRRIDPLVFTS